MVDEWRNSFFPTEIRYTRSAIQLCYLSSKHTIGPGRREGNTNHNMVVEKGRNGNATVDDRRTSICFIRDRNPISQ